jgi:hypothetical protein
MLAIKSIAVLEQDGWLFGLRFYNKMWGFGEAGVSGAPYMDACAVFGIIGCIYMGIIGWGTEVKKKKRKRKNG